MTMPPSTDRPPGPEVMFDLIFGAQSLGIVQAAIELGVFDRLAAGAADVESIAAEGKTDARATRILLDALVATGLVDLDGGYRLSPVAAATLVAGRPGYFGGMLRVVSELSRLASGQLADAVRHGGTTLADTVEAPEHALWEEFAAASAPIVSVQAEALAGHLAGFAAGRGSLRILDVACGSGVWSLTLAARHPAARVTLNDWANVLEVSRTNAERLGLADRTDYLPGDVFEVPLAGPYDVIVASNIFHMFSPDRARTLLNRLGAALAPDGRLAIQGPMAARSPREDRLAYLFSALCLALTAGGEAHSIAAYEEMFADTGLTLLESHDLPMLTTMRSIIAARPTP
jgi:cyclopropane fatty-acyl-phospholipid synthase-like methyltransferase